MTMFWMAGFIMAALAVIAVVVRRSRRIPAPADPDWVALFTIDRYRPMERLLREQDYEFLNSQPGYHPSIARQLRRQRRSILRIYLRSLSVDFDRLYRAGFEMALMSQTDRQDLLTSLARCKFAFRVAMAKIHVHLLLTELGLGAVNVSEALEQVRSLSVATRTRQLQLVSIS